jgi:hypothetical protein
MRADRGNSPSGFSSQDFRPSSHVQSIQFLRSPMIKLNIELPPEVARRFVEDMDAFFAEPNAIKRDEIAARQLHALREHRRPRDPKLRLSDVKELFERRFHR